VLLNLIHANINVTDIERSLEFYETIGFKVMHVFGDRESGDVSAGMSQGSRRVKGAVLSISDDPRASTKIELLQWVDPPATAQHERGDAEAGVARLAIRTKNLLAYCDELRAKGVEFLHEPQEIDIVGARRFVLFKDPDGTLLELIEF
jgi:catechol 2,3-dioxygenase-like lactoylglutathione lyase family enzyme